MSTKIDVNTAEVAYHVNTGAFTFPYSTDARSAAQRHPDEWSMKPWTVERANAARAARKERHDREVAAGVADPVPLLGDPVPLTPEDQAALDEHAKAQAEAAARLEVFDKEEADRKALLDKVAEDRALLATPPPQPDPNVRRPFGRKGEPTEAEKAMLAKRQVKGPVDTADHASD